MSAAAPVTAGLNRRDGINVALRYAETARKATHDGFIAAAKIVEGADVASKLTKFVRAIINVAVAIFTGLAAAWHDLATRIGCFGDITELFMVIVAIKDLFDLAAGEIKGWMKQAAHTCLAAFRIMHAFNFLDKVKLINLGWLVDKVGSVPVFGTIMSVFGVTGLTLLTIGNVKKLNDPKERKKAADAKLAAAEWDLIQAQYIATKFGGESETVLSARPRFFENIIAVTEAVSKQLNAEMARLKVEAERKAGEAERKAGEAERKEAPPIRTNGSNLKQIADHGKFNPSELATELNTIATDLGKRIEAEGKSEAERKGAAAAPGFHDKLVAAKSSLVRISEIFQKFEASAIALAERRELIGNSDAKIKEEDAPRVRKEDASHFVETLTADVTRRQVGVPALMPLLLSAGAIAEASRSNADIQKIGAVYKKAFIERLAFESNHPRVEALVKETDEKRRKEAQQYLEMSRSVLESSRPKLVYPHSSKEEACEEFAEERRQEVTRLHPFGVLPPENVVSGFHGINRFAVFAKESAALKVSERRSLWIDIVDKVVKIPFIILISVGFMGVACLALSTPFMIGLAAFTATLSLAKVAYDKLFKNEVKLKEPSQLEKLKHNLPYELQYIHDQVISKLDAPANVRLT